MKLLYHIILCLEFGLVYIKRFKKGRILVILVVLVGWVGFGRWMQIGIYVQLVLIKVLCVPQYFKCCVKKGRNWLLQKMLSTWLGSL